MAIHESVEHSYFKMEFDKDRGDLKVLVLEVNFPFAFDYSMANDGKLIEELGKAIEAFMRENDSVDRVDVVPSRALQRR